MILPEKHIKFSESLFGFGAVIIKFMNKPMTSDLLWERIGTVIDTPDLPTKQSYNNFILSLSLLYSIGAIDMDKKGKLFKCN